MNPILATCLILAVFLGPLIFCAVMIALVGRAEQKRLNEQADFILGIGRKEPRSDRLLYRAKAHHQTQARTGYC